MSYKHCPKCGIFAYINDPEETVCSSCQSKSSSSKVENVIVTRSDIHPNDSKEESDDNAIVIDLLAAELKKDINYLMELGIKLDKGKLTAETGGLIGAGASAFTGHWLSALAIGGASLLAGGFTKSYHKIKIKEICLKWHNTLSNLDQQQLSTVMVGLQERYPLLFGRFQNLLQALNE